MTWEPPGEDPMEIHIRDAESLMDMTEEEILLAADIMDMDEETYRLWRMERIASYQAVDEDQLTPDQAARLFRGRPL